MYQEMQQNDLNRNYEIGLIRLLHFNWLDFTKICFVNGFVRDINKNMYT